MIGLMEGKAEETKSLSSHAFLHHVVNHKLEFVSAHAQHTQHVERM